MQDLLFPDFSFTPEQEREYEAFLNHENKNSMHVYFFEKDNYNIGKTRPIGNNDAHLAVYCHPNVLKYVIQKNKDLCRKPNHYGMTPLSFALDAATRSYHPFILENIKILIEVEEKMKDTFYPERYKDIVLEENHQVDEDMNDSLYDSDHYDDEEHYDDHDDYKNVSDRSRACMQFDCSFSATQLPPSTQSIESTQPTQPIQLAIDTPLPFRVLSPVEIDFSKDIKENILDNDMVIIQNPEEVSVSFKR